MANFNTEKYSLALLRKVFVTDGVAQKLISAPTLKGLFERLHSLPLIGDFMIENQDKEFERLGIKFKSLWGRKMHEIDCQGMFCELDKYSRVRFPELKSNRVKIKAQYKPGKVEIKYFYPPKWGISTNT